MKKFIVKGWGRRIRAIGINCYFSIVLEAESEADARLRIYDHYEHISSLKVFPYDSKPLL